MLVLCIAYFETQQIHNFIFQYFPGPGKSREKIQDFPGCMGTLLGILAQ